MWKGKNSSLPSSGTMITKSRRRAYFLAMLGGNFHFFRKLIHFWKAKLLRLNLMGYSVWSYCFGRLLCFCLCLPQYVGRQMAWGDFKLRFKVKLTLFICGNVKVMRHSLWQQWRRDSDGRYFWPAWAPISRNMTLFFIFLMSSLWYLPYIHLDNHIIEECLLSFLRFKKRCLLSSGTMFRRIV